MAKSGTGWDKVLSGKRGRVSAKDLKEALGNTKPEAKNKFGNEVVHDELEGITFRSKFERSFYHSLKHCGIEFLHENREELLPGFRYMPDEKALVARTCRIDFFLPQHNIYIDTKSKGTITSYFRYQVFLLKMKHMEKPVEERPAICVVFPSTAQQMLMCLMADNFTFELIKPFRF